MDFPGFIGGSFVDQSLNLNCEDVLNLYYEPGNASSRNRAALLGTPGLAVFTTLPYQPTRGLWAGGFRLFVAAAAHLLEVFADGSFDDRGLIDTDGNPVTIVPNGNQLGLVSAGHFYADSGTGPVIAHFPDYVGTIDVLETKVTWKSGDKFDAGLIGSPFSFVSGITYNDSVESVEDDTHLTLAGSTGLNVANVPYTASPAVTASSLCFLDGYFIVSRPSSKQFNISPLNGADDGNGHSVFVWDPLDFAAKEGYPDDIARVFADHEDLWLFGGEQSTEVWQNTGNANFPFQRIPGNFIHYGCAAPYSVVRLGNGVGWIALDTSRGAAIAIYAVGFQPTRVSTGPVEQAWAGYATIADAVAYTYIDRGHEFWVINFPTANATWVYDLSTNLWARRGWYNGASSDRQKQWTHAYTALSPHGSAPDGTAALHFAGAWNDNVIYKMDAAYLNDAGTPIERIRTCPHLATENKRNFYHRLEIYTEVHDPTITLASSKDGGHTFNTPRSPSATSTLGAFLARTFWAMLGSSRDRVFRVRSLAAIKQAWVAAYIELTQGTS